MLFPSIERVGVREGGWAGDFPEFEIFYTMNPLISFSGTRRIPDQLVILDMKHGVEAKNYEEVRPVSQSKKAGACRAVCLSQFSHHSVLCPEGRAFLNSHVAAS